MRIYRKALAFLLGISLLLTACGSGGSAAEKTSGSSKEADTKTSSEKAGDSTAKRAHADSSMLLSLDENGELTIKRPTRIDKPSEENDGSWTIFVYLCGANLESEGGGATNDMQQMLDANTKENIKFIVQTGGANEWQNDMTDADHFGRFEICNGEAALVDEQPAGDMGDPKSLSDFLKWGVETYPAQNMGLVFWNHGGGSISGVCFDETHDDSSLSLRDIDEALLSINDMLSRNFEFVAFDACLMSTFETANIIASHAYYMYASEESVPGTGLDYTAIGRYINEHPTADGAQIGQVVADSYYEMCVSEAGDGDTPTMSVIDLSKLDDVVVSFNAFSRDLLNTIEETDKLDEVIRSALGAERFGGNNASVGFTNMVDLGGLVDSCSEYSENADTVKKALKNAVSYSVNGPVHADASGLTVYYPICIQGSSELKKFGQIAVSPYYLAFVDIIAYAAANAGDISAYDDSQLLTAWTSHSYVGSDYWSYYDESHETGASPLITFTAEPALDSTGSFGFTLSEDGIQNASSAEAFVYEYLEDAGDIIDLGLSADFNADWETGEISDNFDGYWFSLPDGQNLAVYDYTQSDGYDVYSAPIELNGEETNLIFTHDYNNDTITINGIWDGIDDNGMSERMAQLQPGDKITPRYDSYAVADPKEKDKYVGVPYTYADGDEIQFALMPDGVYLYGFVINDLYGDYYITTMAKFRMIDGQVFYDEE